MSELVDRLEIGPDRAELQAAFALRDRLDARIAAAVADYEAAGFHEVDGSGSIVAWLRRECGRDGRSAARVAATGRTLRALPVLRDAVSDRRLSGGQLDAIVANVPHRHLDRFAEQRDGGCRFGNCDAPPSWCDIHHTDFWEHGGETSIWTGLMGCRRHHRLAHKPGYHVKLLPDGTVKFTHPDGRVETSQPRCLLPQLPLRPPDGS